MPMPRLQMIVDPSSQVKAQTHAGEYSMCISCVAICVSCVVSKTLWIGCHGFGKYAARRFANNKSFKTNPNV